MLSLESAKGQWGPIQKQKRDKERLTDPKLPLCPCTPYKPHQQFLLWIAQTKAYPSHLFEEEKITITHKRNTFIGLFHAVNPLEVLVWCSISTNISVILMWGMWRAMKIIWRMHETVVICTCCWVVAFLPSDPASEVIMLSTLSTGGVAF